MNENKNYIYTLIWALPVLILFYTLLIFFRVPETNYPGLIFKVLALSLALSTLISSFYRRFQVFGVGLVLSLLSIISLGLLPELFHYLFWIFSILLLVLELKHFRKNYNKINFKIFAYSVLALICLLAPYFREIYSEPDNNYKLTKALVNNDTFYHVAIASMIKNYHLVSHGLHGTGPLQYHFGSHALMAAASKLLSFSAFDSYNYFYVFIGVPLLSISVLGCAEEFLKSKKESDYIQKILLYTFLILGIGIFSPSSIVSLFGLWSSVFVSESFAISAIFLMCFISILFNSEKISNQFMLAFLIILTFLFMTFSKVSTGFCSLGLLGSWALLSNTKWWTKDWLFRWGVFFVNMILFLISFKLINPTMGDSAFDPGHFVRTYVDVPFPFWIKLLLFIPIHFIYPIAFFIIYFYLYKKNKGETIFPLWLALGNLFGVAVGMFFVLLFRIQGGSAAYFSYVSVFTSLPVLVCFSQAAFKYFNKKQINLFVKILIIFSLFHAPRAVYKGFKTLLIGLKDEIHRTPLVAYIEKLQTIRDSKDTMNSLVFIPRSEVNFWERLDCRSGGFFISAISERPGIYSWPTKECYSFLCGPRFRSNGLCELSSKNHTNAELLSEAKKLGFSKVKVVTFDNIKTLE